MQESAEQSAPARMVLRAPHVAKDVQLSTASCALAGELAGATVDRLTAGALNGDNVLYPWSLAGLGQGAYSVRAGAKLATVACLPLTTGGPVKRAFTIHRQVWAIKPQVQNKARAIRK